MDEGKEKDGEERSVGKGSRVKLKHKDEGRGEEEAAERKIKMFEEKGREKVSVEERKEEDARGSRRKAKREWWTTVRSRPVACRPQ